MGAHDGKRKYTRLKYYFRPAVAGIFPPLLHFLGRQESKFAVVSRTWVKFCHSKRHEKMFSCISKFFTLKTSFRLLILNFGKFIGACKRYYPCLFTVLSTGSTLRHEWEYKGQQTNSVSASNKPLLSRVPIGFYTTVLFNLFYNSSTHS